MDIFKPFYFEESVLSQFISTSADRSARDRLGLSQEAFQRLLRLAERLLEQKRYEKASQAFFFLIVLEPSSMQSWLGFGMALQQLRNYELSVEVFGYVATQILESPVPYFHLGECFVKLCDTQSALCAFDLAEKYAGELPEYRQLKASLVEARSHLLSS